MDDDQRPGDEGDSTVHRTITAANAERVPDPAAGEGEDPGDAEETGDQAADHAERLESHSRPTTQPHEPGAPRSGGTPPLT